MRKKEILPFVTTYMDLENDAKWNGPEERHILHVIIYTWNLEKILKKTPKKKPQNQTSRTTRGWEYTRKIGRGQSVQNFSYNMNKVWGSNVYYGDCR